MECCCPGSGKDRAGGLGCKPPLLCGPDHPVPCSLALPTRLEEARRGQKRVVGFDKYVSKCASGRAPEMMSSFRVRDPPRLSRQTIGRPSDEGVLVQLRKCKARSLPLCRWRVTRGDAKERREGPDPTDWAVAAVPGQPRDPTAHMARWGRIAGDPACGPHRGRPGLLSSGTRESLQKQHLLPRSPSHLLSHLRPRFPIHPIKRSRERHSRNARLK